MTEKYKPEKLAQGTYSYILSEKQGKVECKGMTESGYRLPCLGGLKAAAHPLIFPQYFICSDERFSAGQRRS
jgi:hypothetical protein